ncbi:hypothetical protein SLEP1_g47693 [Rubroshorea leprosula]|uniref:Uncharacterized protein n=1 Tax=Rubroshorea leprosula TaxID=152421 RepID=A0AAV5LRB7_9ROSI|nr:hypothetical protein SLEP1_g47693 [Rubroshorea leprosula]
MAMSLLSVPPTPHHTSSFPRPYSSTTRVHLPRSSTFTFTKSTVKPLVPLSSSPSSPSSVVEDDPIPTPSSDAIPVQSKSDELPFRGCKACGREEVERGCNGEGRIQGGIATVPGFGWWPIKVYRPCPGFLASGGRYRRQGQSMDEVAFGRGKRGSASGDAGE